MCCHPPVPSSPEISKRDKPINRDERLTACQGREEEEEEALLENLTEKGKITFQPAGMKGLLSLGGGWHWTGQSKRWVTHGRRVIWELG